MTPDQLADTSHRIAGVTWVTAPAGQAAAFRSVLDQYHKKVATIPWIPRDWLAKLEQLSIAAPGDQIPRIYSPYANKGTATPQTDLPDWLQTTERREKWQAVRDEESRIMAPLYRAQVAEAAQAVKDSESRVEFWNTVYTVTETVRDAPALAVNAVANGAVSAIGGNLGRLFSNPATVFLLLAAGGFLWWRYVRPVVNHGRA